MNILVTGGLGINGVWVVRELLHEGHRPIIFENRMDVSLVPDIVDKLDIVAGDILDLASIIRVLKEFKIKRLIHLAGLMPQEAMADPMRGFNVNALGTVNILEAARIMDVERVVFASSKGALGTIRGEYGHPNYKPINEDYPTGKPTVYCATKVASELMGGVYAQLYGLEFIALRFASIYAPGKSTAGRHGSFSIQGKMIENAMLGKETVIPQGGDARDDMVYVKDCAHAFVLGCFVKNVPHHVYHIGTGKGYSLQELADGIKELYPKAVFKIGSGSTYLKEGGMCCVMDISLAKTELGYVPQFGLSEGVRDYVERMRELKLEPIFRP